MLLMLVLRALVAQKDQNWRTLRQSQSRLDHNLRLSVSAALPYFCHCLDRPFRYQLLVRLMHNLCWLRMYVFVAEESRRFRLC